MLENLGAKLKVLVIMQDFQGNRLPIWLVFPAVSSVFMKPANACHR